MKILFLTFYFNPDLCAGSFRAESLVGELRKQLGDNDQLDVLTTMPQRYCSFEAAAEKYEEAKGYRVCRFQLPTHKSGFTDQMMSFVSYYRQVLRFVNKNDYDVVFATSSRLFTAFLGARVARKTGAVLLLDIRDIFRDTMKSLLSKPLFFIINPFLKGIEKYTFSSAKKINLVSEGFNNYFKFSYPKAKYYNFYNGIDKLFFDYDFSKTASDTKKIITYAGNIGQGQGIETIMPQMAQYLGDKYELHIVGDGGRKPVLVKAIEDSKLTNVCLFNPVKRNELLLHYKESDFLFLHLNDFPAFEKVLPSKVFEYAVTGKTIIAGVGGFAKSFIEDNIPNALVFKPSDIYSFKAAFEKYNEEDFNDNNEEFLSKFSRERISEEMISEMFDFR